MTRLCLILTLIAAPLCAVVMPAQAQDTGGHAAQWRTLRLGMTPAEARAALAELRATDPKAPATVTDDNGALTRPDVLFGGGWQSDLGVGKPIPATVTAWLDNDGRRVTVIVIEGHAGLSSSDGLARITELRGYWAWLHELLTLRYGPATVTHDDLMGRSLHHEVGRALWLLPDGAVARAAVGLGDVGQGALLTVEITRPDLDLSP